MKRTLICGASLLSLMLAAALTSGAAGAADTKPKSSKEIMGALFKGPKAAMGSLKTLTKSDSPDWARVQVITKTFLVHAEDLEKNKAPRGEQGSFEKLSKALAVNAKALDKAADAKDLDAVKESMGKIGSSCMACHKAHKPK